MTSETLALRAAETLVEAYRRGQRRGGAVDWSDLDVAHECARAALLHERCAQRRRRLDRPLAAEAAMAADSLLGRVSASAALLLADAALTDAERVAAGRELAHLVDDLIRFCAAGILPTPWRR